MTRFNLRIIIKLLDRIRAAATCRRGDRPAQANLGMEKLRFLFRLAYDLRCVDSRRYEHAARCLDETGRRAWAHRARSV